ncbi:MAG: hypothetical protein JXA30_10330 [Deltaproteobacteria bacterium]|nr:hypothetical protein [Deltaproteobacteria bacterium]
MNKLINLFSIIDNEKLSRLVLVVALGLWLPAPARAQQAIKPYVHVIMDTSYSMGYPCRGTEPPAQCSEERTEPYTRMERAVAALADVFAGIGEVRFALQGFQDWSSCPDPCTDETLCKNTDCLHGEVLVDFTVGNESDLYRWVDGSCDSENGNYELRSYGSGGTPILNNLAAAYDHIETDVIPDDERSACRPYVVVLVTDGDENCISGCKTDCTENCLTPEQCCQPAIDAIGDRYDTQGIKTYIIGYADYAYTNRDCLTNMAVAGGTGRGDATMVASETDIALAFQEIVSESILVEVCDGEDNDCDGSTDEGYSDLGRSCAVGVGPCRREGEVICTGDGLDTECSVDEAGEPEQEVCDKIDNDCDGYVDEDLDCSPACEPETETCNSVDDDCDNAIDESDPNMNAECGVTVGSCEAGRMRCINGELECVGGVLPRPEVCDGEDNDCNGLVDDDAPCPENAACVNEACRRPCDRSREFSCPVGFSCESIEGGSYCIPSACASCSSEERCIDGQCVDLCHAVTCEKDERCIDGTCVTCRYFDCPKNQICVDDACIDDPCHDVNCDGDEACRDGECVGLCIDALCPEGERCNSKWRCERFGCKGGCKTGEYCDGKSCRDDPYVELSCPEGDVCIPGEGCVADPCLFVTCPGDSPCVLSSGFVPQCPDARVKVTNVARRLVATGGGGISGCSIPGRGKKHAVCLWWLMLLACSVLRARRAG